MSNVTVIGEGAVVRGRIQGEGDLTIAGRVEGDVEVSGEVVVEAKGLVAANLTAQRVVVRGAVRGDLVGAESIELDAGARVVGDARAPRIRVATGALIRGFVTTGPRESGASKSRAAVSAARPAPKPAAAPKRVEAPQSAPAPKKAEPPKPVAKVPAKPASKSAPARGATIAGARPGPPAPVVPALRKGAKAVHKKRA